MNVIGAYFSYGIILITISALPVQKEVISTRLVTRWELEFVSLNLAASASKLPCPAEGTVLDLPSLSVATRYKIPKRPVGKIHLSMNQPKMDCERGVISLGNADSPSLMIITAKSDQTCLSEAPLRLYINIGLKDESTSSAFFHTKVYPEQTTIEWKEKFLLDDTGSSILRLKWRVTCRHYLPDNHQRLKRQIPDSPGNGSETTDTNGHTSLNPLSQKNDTQNIPSTASPTISGVENSTERAGNSSLVEPNTNELGSGEPPNSFVTGISETFGFTKTSKPSKNFSNLLNQLRQSTEAVVLSNLTTLGLGNSLDSNTSSQKATDPSSSPVPQAVHNPNNHDEDKQTTLEINAPAASDGEHTNPPLKTSGVKADFSVSTLSITVSTTAKPALVIRPGDREDQNSATETQSTTSKKTSTPLFKSSTPLVKSITPSVKSITPSVKSITPSVKLSTPPSKTRGTRPGDREIPIPTTKTLPTTKQPNRPANSENTTTLKKRSTPTSSPPVPTKSPTTPHDKEDKKSSPITTATFPTTTSTAKSTTITKRPNRPGDKNRTPVPITTSTPSPTKIRPGNKPLVTTTTTSRPTRPGDRTLAPALTNSPSTSTKRDVIFTAPKPTPTYPDRSNEPYIGNTGETSSAGWVKNDPRLVSDDDEPDEATIWPIVMGLVVGIPTIIVIAIAITVVQKKHFGLPQRTMSSPGGYFERKPPQVPFVTNKPPRRTLLIDGPPTDIDV